LIGKKKKCERRAREEKKQLKKQKRNQSIKITFINNAWEQCFMKAIGGIDV
jgi:hypothetical protein